MLMQRNRIGRGVLQRRFTFRGHDADRAEACRLQARRRPDLAQKGCDGGLAVGARDRGHGPGLRAAKARGEQRQGLPRLLGAQNWNGKSARIRLRAGQDRHRAALDRALREGHAVRLRARQRGKQHPRPDQPAIFRKARNFLGQGLAPAVYKRDILDQIR